MREIQRERERDRQRERKREREREKEKEREREREREREYTEMFRERVCVCNRDVQCVCMYRDVPCVVLPATVNAQLSYIRVQCLLRMCDMTHSYV